MAEKITASWFNKIVAAITRIKNLKQDSTGQSFSFSTEGLTETKVGKTYKLEDIQKINKIIENMAQDDLLKQTDNESYTDKTILYNVVAIGEKGEKPTLIQKSALDSTIASWSYIKCPNSAANSYGYVKGVQCSPFGSNYIECNPNGTKTVCDYCNKVTANCNVHRPNGCVGAKTCKVCTVYCDKGTNKNVSCKNGSCTHGDCSNKGICDAYQICQQGTFIDIRCQNVTQG